MSKVQGEISEFNTQLCCKKYLLNEDMTKSADPISKPQTALA